MKSLLLISIYLAAACLPVPAQVDGASYCPKIEITGPSGVTRPGDTLTFIVNVSEEDPEKYKYNWAVSAGTIEDGQGTSAITVRSKTDNCEINYTATVEIAGLPTGCANTTSETAVVQRPGNPDTIDSYERIPFSKEKIRLSAAAKEAKNSNDLKLILVLVLYRTKLDSLPALKKRSESISRFLRTIGLGKKDFLFVFGEGRTYSTRIYLMPSDRCVEATALKGTVAHEK